MDPPSLFELWRPSANGREFLRGRLSKLVLVKPGTRYRIPLHDSHQSFASIRVHSRFVFPDLIALPRPRNLVPRALRILAMNPQRLIRDTGTAEPDPSSLFNTAVACSTNSGRWAAMSRLSSLSRERS